MKKDYNDNRKALGVMLKTEAPNTPIQEVRPVEAKPAAIKPASEVHVNFWTDTSLARRLKVYAALNGKSIKEVCTEALEAYLPKEK